MKKYILFIILFTALSVNNIIGQTPTADDIVEAYLTTMGSAMQWKKIESMRQTGSIVSEGVKMPCTIVQMRPNLNRIDIELPNNITATDAFDGTVAWQQNPAAGMPYRSKKIPEEIAEAASEVFEDELLDYQAKGHSIELNGLDTMDNINCFKLTLNRKIGDKKIYFIRTDNYSLLNIRSFIVNGVNKGKAIDMFLSDYKEVSGGLLMPHTMDIRFNDMTIRIVKIDKIEINPLIDKKMFNF